MSIDFAAIRASVDLVGVASRYTTLSKWLNGPCPMCGGTDRFYIQNDREHWKCRGCDKKGDVIDLVSLVENVSKSEAVKMLVGDHATRREPARPVQAEEKEAWRDDEWQSAARSISEEAARNILAPACVAYLASRGISAEVASTYGAGFVASHYCGRTQSRRPAIVLSWQFPDGTITAIKYRYVDDRAKGELRFGQLKGSKPLVFGLQTAKKRRRLIVTEGEFNCLAIRTVTDPDEIDVISVGSEKNTKPLPPIAAHYTDVVLWLDKEELAQRAKAEIAAEGRTVTALHSINGRDACDVLQDGADVLRARLSPPLATALVDAAPAQKSDNSQPAAPRALWPEGTPYRDSEHAAKMDAFYCEAKRWRDVALASGTKCQRLATKELIARLLEYDALALHSWEQAMTYRAEYSQRMQELAAVSIGKGEYFPLLEGEALREEAIRVFGQAPPQEGAT